MAKRKDIKKSRSEMTAATSLEDKVLFDEASDAADSTSSATTSLGPCSQVLSVSGRVLEDVGAVEEAPADEEDYLEISKFGDIESKVPASLAANHLTATSAVSLCDLDSAKARTPSLGRKQTPLLAIPPGLVRRFADCDLTGDCQQLCHLREDDKSPKPDLPTEASIPGDNNEDARQQLLHPKRSWGGRLFHSLKNSLSRKSSLTTVEKVRRTCSEAYCGCGGGELGESLSNNLESGSRVRAAVNHCGQFKPMADLFHLFKRGHHLHRGGSSLMTALKRRQSFMEEQMSVATAAT